MWTVGWCECVRRGLRELTGVGVVADEALQTYSVRRHVGFTLNEAGTDLTAGRVGRASCKQKARLIVRLVDRGDAALNLHALAAAHAHRHAKVRSVHRRHIVHVDGRQNLVRDGCAVCGEVSNKLSVSEHNTLGNGEMAKGMEMRAYRNLYELNKIGNTPSASPVIYFITYY